MIFIDWLSVHQEFQGLELPLLASELRTTTCAITGEVLRENTIGYVHKGSYDSSILIKFDKGVLSMSGNPSAWGKPDNLWGVTSVHDALEVFNGILRGLGYPEFYDCEDTHLTAKPLATTEKYFRDGLNITRVDLTCNYASDCDPLTMLKYLSTNNYRANVGYLYPNGRTVEWMGQRQGDNSKGSRHVYFKYYDKAFDIEKKLKKAQAELSRMTIKHKEENKVINQVQGTDTNITKTSFYVLSLTDQERIQQKIDYLTKLYRYALDHNIIRFELELKSRKLNELNLNKLSRWTRETMAKIYELYLPHNKQKVEYNKKIDLYQQLIDLRITPSKATTISQIGHLWLDGHDVNYRTNPMIKKNTYYRARTALLALGFDIAAPLNIVAFPTNIQTVSLKSLEAPDWYQTAA